MPGEIINKVSDSGLVTVDLEDYYPREEARLFDLKDHLFMGLILKEKEFREALKNLDTEPYRGKNVAIFCTADAVIPMWAYMLVASLLEPIAKNIVFGDLEVLHRTVFLKNISGIDTKAYLDKKVVIKGCGELPVPETAYVEITRLLRPVAKSIMYGEPCSTVPIFKQKSVPK
jgi:hypothetical protein